MTPQEILAKFSAIPKQDMIEYVTFLREISRGNVLEIGVCQGVSTSAFLLGMDEKNDGHLMSIDIDPKCEEILSHPRWTFIQGDTRVMELKFYKRSFDVLLIDGDHAYQTAISDLIRFSPIVKPGGLILMHDVCPSDYARQFFKIDDTKKAWDDFCLIHPDWPTQIMPRLFGLGVMTVQ